MSTPHQAPYQAAPYPVSTLASDEAMPHSPAFEALNDIVRDARRGEVRLPPAPPMASGPSAPRLEPEPRLPSSWYGATATPEPDFRQDMLRAAGFGLATGFLLLAPLLWYSSDRVKRPQISHSEPLPGLTLASRSVDIVATGQMTPSDRMRAIIELARLRVIVGDIIAARTVLSRADVARDADALFLMAETYDPQMLDIWGVKSVAADSDRARALYAAANALGHIHADERLAALK